MLYKCSIWKTAEVFFLSPTARMYLLDISRRTKLAHTSTKNNIKYLLDNGIINEIIEKRGKRKFPLYFANLNSDEYKKYKRLYNLFSLSDSGIIKHIADNIMPRCIVLFGSYLRGEDIEDSDIDLFVEARGEEIDLSTFDKKLRRKVQLHFSEKFSNYPKELRNNVINGSVQYGFLECY